MRLIGMLDSPYVRRVAISLRMLDLAAACKLLEAEIGADAPWLFGDKPLQADITSAVAFRFTSEIVPDALDLTAYPRLAALSARAEATDAFRVTPFS